MIIGDSVHDITCAKVNGLRSLAVATGWTPYSELQEASPDFLIKDFSDINKSLSILLGCS